MYLPNRKIAQMRRVFFEELLSSKRITGDRSCFLEQETLPLLISTSWFQEQF